MSIYVRLIFYKIQINLSVKQSNTWDGKCIRQRCLNFLLAQLLFYFLVFFSEHVTRKKDCKRTEHNWEIEVQGVGLWWC